MRLAALLLLTGCGSSTPAPVEEPGGYVEAASPEVAPTVLEGNRTSGTTQILPPAAVKAQAVQDQKSTLESRFQLCVHETGLVTHVEVLTSSGYPDYDALIVQELWTWTYRPYLIDGTPSKVCTAVTITASV